MNLAYVNAFFFSYCFNFSKNTNKTFEKVVLVVTDTSSNNKMKPYVNITFSPDKYIHKTS